MRRAKCRGIQNDEPGKSLRQGKCCSQPDRPTPIVGNKRHLAQIQVLDKSLKIVDVVLQPIGILLRLVAQAATDVIDGNHAILRSQSGNQGAPIKRPSWVAVNQYQWPALSFVDVMQAMAIDKEIMRFERIQRLPIVGHR